ncbi:hypothetical protein, partial [Curtobacterium sp. B8]|uniref:hypothetical protein n=1 Tax=Curtobacterium sp. B8 TaxID=95611 RepID=UPI0005B2B0EA
MERQQTGAGATPTWWAPVWRDEPPWKFAASGTSATPTRTCSASASRFRRSHSRASGRVAMSRTTTGSTLRYQESSRCSLTSPAIRTRVSAMSCRHSSKVLMPFFFARDRCVRKVPTTITGEAAAIMSMIGRAKTIAIVTPST